LRPYKRKNVINEIMKLIPEFKEFCTFNGKNIQIHSYYCNTIMKLAEIIRTMGKSINKGLQHDIFKSIFAKLELNQKYVFEKYVDGQRRDILITESGKIIEVKTISNMSHKKIADLISYALDIKPEIDRLWVFYFMHIDTTQLDSASRKRLIHENKECIYLLVFVDILLTGVIDLTEINTELEKGTKKIGDEAAEKLDIPRTIILPLENVILVEDIKRELEKEREKREKLSKELEERDKKLDEMSQKLKERDKKLDEMSQKLKERDMKLDEMSKKLDEMSKKLDEMSRKLKEKDK